MKLDNAMTHFDVKASASYSKVNVVPIIGLDVRVELPLELSSEDTQRMFGHIQKCDQIR